MTDDDEINYGAPPHLTTPAGSEAEQTAWLRARIQEGLDSPIVERDIDEVFDDIKRRGRVWLEQSKAA